MASMASCTIWWNLVKSLVACITSVSVINPINLSFSITINLSVFPSFKNLMTSENLASVEIILNSLFMISLTFFFLEMAPFIISFSVIMAIGLSFSMTTGKLLTNLDDILVAASTMLEFCEIVTTSFVIMLLIFIIFKLHIWRHKGERRAHYPAYRLFQALSLRNCSSHKIKLCHNAYWIFIFNYHHAANLILDHQFTCFFYFRLFFQDWNVS